ncbi:MAG TPA: Uma2 family endonuclease [Pyrinomonadaceae bacterium]|nr:Uma2 family endonuclease [Pyrinomonadaceae bacterium]
MVWVNTSPLVKTYTLEEFWELPEPPDHSKIELIAGVLYMTPPPEKPHGRAVSRLNRFLDQYLIKIGDKGTLYTPRTGISVTPNTWLEPDLFYVSAETEAQSTTRYHTTADLVVEVISPGSAIYDRNTKADTYAALRVKELWLVDEFSGSIEIRVLKGDSYESTVFYGDDRLVSTVLPGFGFKISSVFEDQP